MVWGIWEAYPVIRLEVIDLLSEYECPEIFAEELDDIQHVDEAGAIAGESVGWTCCQRWSNCPYAAVLIFTLSLFALPKTILTSPLLIHFTPL